MATTNYSGLSQRTTAWAVSQHLEHAKPIAVLAEYGMTQAMPKNKAKTLKFRRPIPLALATTPLTEGTPPTAKAMQYEDVTVTLDQLGDVIEITDVVNDLAEDPVLSDAVELTGEQSQETIEALLWGVIGGGTNVFYANGTARNQVNTKITLSKQRAVIRKLKNERAKKVTKKVASTVKYGTEAINAAYLAFAHTDLEADIRDLAGFVPVEKYGSMKALPYEIGKVEDVRYICTPILDSFADAGAAHGGAVLSTSGTLADVYPIIYVGKDAYGHTVMKGKDSVNVIVVNPDKADKSDPLGQKGTVGWKCYWQGMILNEAWLCRLEVGASEL